MIGKSDDEDDDADDEGFKPPETAVVVVVVVVVMVTVVEGTDVVDVIAGVTVCVADVAGFSVELNDVWVVAELAAVVTGACMVSLHVTAAGDPDVSSRKLFKSVLKNYHLMSLGVIVKK